MRVDALGEQQTAHCVLLVAGDDHKELFRAQDVAHAHGERVARHIVARGEEALVGVDGALVEHLLVRAVAERVARLVEAEMTVRADAEHLHVNVGAVEHGVELAQILLNIAGALCDIGVGFVDVDVVKKIAVHEITVALLMGGGETDILVEIHAVNAGEVQSFLAAAPRKLPVHADRARAGGEAERAAGVRADRFLQNVSGKTADLFVIFGDDYFQDIFSFIIFLRQYCPWLCKCTAPAQRRARRTWGKRSRPARSRCRD